MLRYMPACLMLFVITQPCDADIILDNFTETSTNVFTLRSTFFGTQTTARAQQFNTGGFHYSLDSISIQILRDTATTDFAAQLWTASGNLPATSVVNLSLANSPPPGANQTHVFTPDNYFVMNAGQDYFFSIQNNIGANSFLHATPTGSNNYTGPGTLISIVASSTNNGASWASTSSNEMLFRLEGTFVPEPSALASLGLIGLLAMGIRQRND